MKRFLIAVLSIFLILSIIVSIKYRVVKNTKKVPYCNLNKFSSSDYYIFLNILYRGETYRIVCGNFKLANLFSREKGIAFRPLYSVWMNEVIKHNWNVRVNDNMYTSLMYDIVKNGYVKKHEERKTVNNVIISGSLPEDLTVDDYKAIVYLLLKNGINCHKNSESGKIVVDFP